MVATINENARTDSKRRTCATGANIFLRYGDENARGAWTSNKKQKCRLRSQDVTRRGEDPNWFRYVHHKERFHHNRYNRIRGTHHRSGNPRHSRDARQHSRDARHHSRDARHHSRDARQHSRDARQHSRDYRHHSRDYHHSSSPSCEPYSSGSSPPPPLHTTSILEDTDQVDAGRFVFERGTVIRNRYEVLRLAGEGTFGTVVVADDIKRKRRVALKIVRGVRTLLDDARFEIKNLDHVAESQSSHPGGKLCAEILKDFYMHHRGIRHRCIVLQNYGRSFYQFMKHVNHGMGFALDTIRQLGFQLFQALDFLHTHCNLVHTDLKPENILLVDNNVTETRDANGMLRMSPVNPQLRLIDFGSAVSKDGELPDVINTRQYRGPEAVLGLEWNEISDMWSAGCCLAEMWSGKLLFPTHDASEHIAMMEHVLGERIPGWMRKKGDVQKRYGGLSNAALRSVRRTSTLAEVVKDEGLRDVIRACLRFDPGKRVNATEAMKMKFFDSVENV